MGLSRSDTANTLETVSEIGTVSDRSTELSHHTTPHVPDKPLITIERNNSWSAINLRELWVYRELLYFLTWRDVKVRYKQTALGVAWVIMQPLLTMLVFTLLFGQLAGMEKRTGGMPYTLFAYAGLLPWTFFANAITTSANSLVNNANLITKVYFPRMIIPGASVAAGLVDFALAFIILGGLMVYYAISPSWNLLLLPPLLLLTSLLATGTGMWLSALNVRYRDVRFALPFLIQMWMFLSPVIYPPELIPEKWRWILLVNPLTGIIEGFRSAVFGRSINWMALGSSTLIALVVLIYASYSFRRTERSFADIV